jgi:UDP-N-acetylmuramate dehydrogenase
VFKNDLKNQVFITHIDLKLSKTGFHTINTSYKPVQDWIESHKIDPISIQSVYDAVVSIRSSKLPNPAEIGNAGSFFKNPIISIEKYNQIKARFPDVPSYPISDIQVKIPAGWLIEKAGWKGFREGDVGVYPKQALVLVNYGNARGEELLHLANRIIDSVFAQFSITLEPEVNLIV